MTGRGRNTHNSTLDASEYKTQDIPRVQAGIFSDFACNNSFIGTVSEKQINNLIRQPIHLLKCPISNMSFCQKFWKKYRQLYFHNWYLRAMTSAHEHNENWQSWGFFLFF